MTRRVLMACVIAGWASRAAVADAPVALTPFAPAGAYVPAGGAVVPAGGGGPAYRAPVSELAPPGGCAACEAVDRVASGCGPDARGWLQADYLLWAVRSGGTPPLLVSDLPGTARTAVGVPGTPGQRTLLGGSDVNGDLRSGFRINGG